MMLRTALALAFALAAGSAFAADKPFVERPLVIEPQLVPFCDDPRVFERVAEAFHDKESEYWNSDLRLVAFIDPDELGYRTWGPEFIPRRFCLARTHVSDGIDRQVYYSIGHKTGTLGITWGVEWCVTGLDRNLAFAPACRMAGP